MIHYVERKLHLCFGRQPDIFTQTKDKQPKLEKVSLFIELLRQNLFEKSLKLSNPLAKITTISPVSGPRETWIEQIQFPSLNMNLEPRYADSL